MSNLFILWTYDAFETTSCTKLKLIDNPAIKQHDNWFSWIFFHDGKSNFNIWAGIINIWLLRQRHILRENDFEFLHDFSEGAPSALDEETNVITIRSIVFMQYIVPSYAENTIIRSICTNWDSLGSASGVVSKLSDFNPIENSIENHIWKVSNKCEDYNKD